MGMGICRKRSLTGNAFRDSILSPLYVEIFLLTVEIEILTIKIVVYGF
jgi:hypothetical protein